MNQFTIDQVAPIINAVNQQLTGQTALAPITNAGDFVAVAQTALLSGRDKVLNVINELWARTIFAVRPLNDGLDGLYMDLPRFGNAVRKLSPVAGVALDDDAFKWPVTYDATQTANPLGNGQSVDHYTIHKQEVVQTNFYGMAVYEQAYTTFLHQFDTAFTGPDEFARFNSMNLTERYNDRQRFRKSVARALQVNYLGALIAENDTYRVVHLLTEYNHDTGLSLTATTVMQPGNYADFIRWLYARLNTLAMMMAEDSQQYQTVINGKPVLRHTDASNLRVALLAQYANQIRSMALSTTYNDSYLTMAEFDAVPFWQSIQSPDQISVTPVYTGTSGQVVTGSATAQSKVLGVMHDRDALGYSDVYNASHVTPLNAKGEYWTTWDHTNFRTIMDMTEKGVVLLLD